MDNADVLDPRSRANDNRVTTDRSYSEVTGGSAPQDVPLPAVVSHDDNVMKSTYADNELPRRPCSVFFKLAHQAFNMRSLFQDISKIGISPSSVRCLQRVSEGAYVITFKDPEERRIFSEKSSFISRPEKESVTVFIHDAPFELPDKALRVRLQCYGEVFRITRGRYPACTHVETGIRYVKMCIDDAIPSFIRFGRRLVRVSYQGQDQTCRRCNQPGHQAKNCHTKFCFNCEHVGHEAPDCVEPILCSICKDPGHLARHCPCGWISPRVPVEKHPDAPPAPQAAESNSQPTQEPVQPASPLDLSSQSSESSSTSSTQSSSSPTSPAPSSPSFSPPAEIPHSSDDDTANMEIVPDPPPATNPTTTSDEELIHGVISDASLLNSDVDIDPDLHSSKRSAETSNSEFVPSNRKKKR